MRYLTSAVALVLLSQSAVAGEVDPDHGNGFYELCADTQKSVKWGEFCAAYVRGLYQGTEGAMAFAEVQAESKFKSKRLAFRKWCVPNTATTQQVLDTFVKYLRENPQTRDQATAWLFMLAMSTAFPPPQEGTCN